MEILRWVFKAVAFVVIVGGCNLAAAARAEPREPGKGYFSVQRNLRLHIVWSAVGIAVGILFLRG